MTREPSKVSITLSESSYSHFKGLNKPSPPQYQDSHDTDEDSLSYSRIKGILFKNHSMSPTFPMVLKFSPQILVEYVWLKIENSSESMFPWCSLDIK